MLWIHKLTVVLLVQVVGEMAFLPAVTAVMLHQIAMDTCTDCSDVSTGYRGNGGSAFSYFSPVTSHCYGSIDWVQICLYSVEVNLRFCLQLLQCCYTTFL